MTLARARLASLRLEELHHGPAGRVGSRVPRSKDGRQVLAFVELDLGTMIRPRLRVKAAGYAAYVYERAWAQRHPFCPALLFLTTGEARALAFLKLLASELERLGRGRWRGWCLRSGPARDFELWDVVSYRRRTNRDSIWIGTRWDFPPPEWTHPQEGSD